MKTIILAATMLLFSAQGFAGSPEFDAVGDDSTNFFNDAIRDAVVANNVNGLGVQVNLFSDFFAEGFTTSGSENPDPCFPGYTSYYAGPRNTNTYTWRIVLQMKPESDLDIVIRDCVLQSLGNVYTEATQTGRFRNGDGTLNFVAAANPSIVATVASGPKHNFGSFTLDSRIMPLLVPVPLTDLVAITYTSKGVWAESIVVAMPEDGAANTLGEPTVRLREGDVVSVTVNIPGNNPNHIFYGEDNVALEYVGEIGTWLTN